jgi:mannose-1-phosphate guanylyltransferase/mannose-6-phosphate isomerase
MYHAVVLCGGSGTRLWPLTRNAMPKQFLPLLSARPLLIETIERLKRSAPPERIWIVAGRAHEPIVRTMLAGVLPGQNLIFEPLARDSTGAVGLAMARLLRVDPDAVFTAFHSDHVIENAPQFDAAVALASRLAADGPIVNVGAAPTYPETGYGYVERGRALATGDGVVAYEVIRFHEKPSADRAAEYVRAGTFLWNVGMFTWRASVVRDLLAEHLPGSVARFERTERLLASDPEAALATFAELPRISVDHAILEKARNRVVIEADLGWLDIGDWAAMYAATGPKDADGNVAPAEGVLVGARGTYLSTTRPGKVIAAVGVEDLVVVDTEDALLVARRDRAQDVRKAVDELKRRGLERHL